MDIAYLFTPVVTSGVVAAIASIAALVTLYMSRTRVLAALDTLRAKIFTRNGFFWTVNLVFMGVSVLHAGVFFGITGQGTTTVLVSVHGKQIPVAIPSTHTFDLNQALGFAVSFFLDLVTVILMQAMLESRYRGEDNRARQFLFFICITCGTSTFANLAISLNDFDAAKMLPHAPFWVQAAAPYVLASFPLFVIMMSIAAEMIINVRPLDQLNEEDYEADEKKRVRILQIRNTYLQLQANEELKSLQIRAQMKANKVLRRGKTFRWFWQKPVDTEVVIANITAQLKALYEPQIEALKKQLSEVQTVGNAADRTTAIPDVLSAQNGGMMQDKAEENSMNIDAKTERILGQNDTAVSSDKGENGCQASVEIEIDKNLLTLTKNYPRIASEWISANRKTATLEEIIEVTGQTKRRLNKANLRRSTRNPELIVLSSVYEWLKSAPLPVKAAEQTGELSEDTEGSDRIQNLLTSALTPKLGMTQRTPEYAEMTA